MQSPLALFEKQLSLCGFETEAWTLFTAIHKELRRLAEVEGTPVQNLLPKLCETEYLDLNWSTLTEHGATREAPMNQVGSSAHHPTVS